MAIYPLAQSELEGTAPDLLARLFAEPEVAITGRPSSTNREDYIARLARGGFPLALARHTEPARSRWFNDYARLTLKRDVRELSKVRQVRALPALLTAWGTTLTSRSANAPKLHVLNSGVAGRLVRLTPDKLARRDATSLTEFGHLLETFVVGELLKEASWMDGIAGAGHWRT